MDHATTGQEEPDQTVGRAADQQARDREALRRRVRESLLRVPEGETTRSA